MSASHRGRGRRVSLVREKSRWAVVTAVGWPLVGRNTWSLRFAGDPARWQREFLPKAYFVK